MEIYLRLIAGLVLLVISGDFLVKGGSAIAYRLRISPLIVGMTVIAFGTSAPELLVSLQAAWMGNSEIALGNVIGSNIANIGLILGLTSVILPIAVNRVSIIQDWPMMMLASVLLWVASWDGSISRIEGGIALISLITFTYWSIQKSRKEIKNSDADNDQKNLLSLPVAALYVIASSVGLALGAKYLVSGASSIAQTWGVSERIIGVTIVAFGTSVPELAASVAAALKKEMDISIGNIIGSNLFNILCVLGLTSIIQPIPIDYNLFRFDLLWMLAFAVLLLLFMLPYTHWLKKEKRSLRGGVIGRIEGGAFVLLYIVYVAMTVGV